MLVCCSWARACDSPAMSAETFRATRRSARSPCRARKTRPNAPRPELPLELEAEELAPDRGKPADQRRPGARPPGGRPGPVRRRSSAVLARRPRRGSIREIQIRRMSGLPGWCGRPPLAASSSAAGDAVPIPGRWPVSGVEPEPPAVFRGARDSPAWILRRNSSKAMSRRTRGRRTGPGRQAR